ncbi:hypothetical protein Alg215_06780 [Pyrenophora tritici-repentis]|nr:hypothetical protein Alg215_06780 [Pyrenophora tritici-repentis]
MSDIERSFAFLHDNIPQWLQDIASIEERVTAMQDENEKIAISHSPFGKESASNASILPEKLDVIDETAAPASRSPTNGPGSRKRSLSVSSGHVYGSARHRPRTMVVVKYDGDMQKSFELLVRAIGTGRHMLRKAKMEAKMNEMAAQADLSRVNYRARMSSLRARSAARRSGRLGVSSGVSTPAELFDTTDKALEQSQELSEKAAHLILREGDCRKELDAVQKHFTALLETAKTEVAKCNARKSSQDVPELQAHETSDTSLSSIEPQMPSYKKNVLPPQTSLPIPQSEALAKPDLDAYAAPGMADEAGSEECGDGEAGGEGSGVDVDETGDELVADPVKVTAQQHQKEHRDLSLPAGIDLDNLISPQNPRLTLTPPDLNATASSHNLRHRAQSKLVYDVKYHPMDDSIRPSQAAKRRSAHGEEPAFDSDDSNEACNFDMSADESSDEHSEIEVQPRKRAAKGKKQILVQMRLTPREGTRRSTRKVSEPKTSYNMDVHPQDKFLVISSDDDEERVPTKKRRKLTHAPIKVDSDSDDEVARFNDDGDEVQYINSEKSDSDEEPVLASCGGNQDQNNYTTVNTSSPPTSTNPPHDSGIRRREGMDIWHLPLGTRYFRHDRDAWPVLHGQPFKIFHEKLEDQLAREALLASPLAYPHDDKENSTTNIADDVDPDSDSNDGVEIMPASQYRQSSQDRELSLHRAQLNNVLYGDDLPLSSSYYGLDGTHATQSDGEEVTDTFSEAMCVLASGGQLPRLPREPEQAQPETQDSVIGLYGKSGGAEDADSVMGSSFSCGG